MKDEIKTLKENAGIDKTGHAIGYKDGYNAGQQAFYDHIGGNVLTVEMANSCTGFKAGFEDAYRNHEIKHGIH